MKFRTYCSLGPITAVAAALVTQPACMSEQGATGGTAIAVDRTTQALTSGELQSVNGTYTNCSHHVDASSWSIEIASGGPLDNPALTVILNDTNCVLTLTSLHTSAGVIDAMPPIALTTSYQASPSAFGSPVEFYANAKLDSLDFADNIVLTLVYSDDSRLVTRSSTANFAVVSSSAASQTIAAPDYALDPGGLALLTDVNNVVVSAVGAATLTEGSVTGQTYVVVDEDAVSTLDTYGELDAAYRAAVPSPIASSIPAADFTLVEDNLTTSQIRTVIIANSVDGVASYQALSVTFNKAP